MPRLRPPAAQISWRKSSCSLASGECVEIASISGDISIRDSTGQPDVQLCCDVGRWQAFIAAIKGAFADG
jgi:hypothetical protein